MLAELMSTIASFGILRKTSPFLMLSAAKAYLRLISRVTLDVSIVRSESSVAQDADGKDVLRLER